MEAKREAEKQEMIEIVESEEAKVIFEDYLKRAEENALSKGARIQSYEVDDSQLQYVPTGGLGVVLIVNGNSNLTLSMILVQEESGKLRGSGQVISRELINFINEVE